MLAGCAVDQLIWAGLAAVFLGLPIGAFAIWSAVFRPGRARVPVVLASCCAVFVLGCWFYVALEHREFCKEQQLEFALADVVSSDWIGALLLGCAPALIALAVHLVRQPAAADRPTR